jgi:hypothetical protein
MITLNNSVLGVLLRYEGTAEAAMRKPTVSMPEAYG